MFKSCLKAAIIAFFLVCHSSLIAQQDYSKSTAIADNNAVSITNPDITRIGKSVNEATGDISFPLNLISAPGYQGLGISVAASYSSNIQLQNRILNKDAQTGIMGLGWNLSIPKIIRDHKNTGNFDDDTFYLNEGGSSIELVFIGTENYTHSGQSYSSERYETTSFTNWKVRYIPDLERWEVTKDDLTKYIYGDNTNYSTSLQLMVKWGNWIGHGSSTTGQSNFVYMYNLSRVENRLGDFLEYTYLNITNETGSFSGYLNTEASYIHSITNKLGYSVLFNYAYKESFEYYESHTEKSEPDAYQERYEDRYLEWLKLSYKGSLLQQTNLIYQDFAVQTGNNISDDYKKRFLSSVETTDKLGVYNTLINFNYFDNHSSFNFGLLESVTDPRGSKVSFEYEEKNVGSLSLDVNTPGGNYKEAQVWEGDDYFVVGWRYYGTSGIDTPVVVKFDVYWWDGKWRSKQLLFTGLAGWDDVNKAYTGLDVSIEADYFAVTYQSTSPNTKQLITIVNKDEPNNDWLEESYSFDFGSNFGSVLETSERFIAVVPNYQATGKYVILSRNNQGTWTMNDNLSTGVEGKASIASGPDFISIYQRQIIVYPSNWETTGYLSFAFVDKNGIITQNNKAYEFDQIRDEFIEMIAGNDFVLALIDRAVDRIIKVGENNSLNTVLTEELSNRTNSQTNIVNNQVMVVTDGVSLTNLLSFNGSTWSLKNHLNSDLPLLNYIESQALGEDFYLFSNNLGQTYRISYNANDGWSESEETFTASKIAAHWGYGFLFPDFFRRNNDGTYTNIPFIPTPALANGVIQKYFPGSPKFAIAEFRNGATSERSLYYYQIKNDDIIEILLDPPSPESSSRYAGIINNPGNGLNQFYTTNNIDPRLITNLKLHKVVDDKISGTFKDYPVKKVTVHVDNTFDHANMVTSYNYDASTITYAGGTVFYSGVTVSPGSTTQGGTDYGTIVKNFHVGGSPYMLGLTEKTSTVAQNGKEHSTENIFSLKTFDIENLSNEVVGKAYLPELQSTKVKVDDVASTTNYTYKTATRQLSKTTATNYDAERNLDTYTTEYKYYWEEYGSDLLTPQIEAKQSINGIVKSANVATWKNGNIYRTFENINGNINFTNWVNPSQNINGWLLTSELKYNSDNFVKEVVDVDGIITATKYAYDGLPILTVSNALETEIWAEDFNDGNIDTDPNTWSKAGSWDFSNGLAHATNSSGGASLGEFLPADILSNSYIFEADIRLENNAQDGFITIDLSTTASGTGYGVLIYPSGLVEFYDGSSLKQTGFTEEKLNRWQPIRVVIENSNATIYLGNLTIIKAPISNRSGQFVKLETNNIKAAFDNLRIYPSDAFALSESYDVLFRTPSQVKKENGSTNYMALDESNSVYAIADHNLNPINNSSYYNSFDITGEVNTSSTHVSTTMNARSRGGYFENFDLDIGQLKYVNSQNSSSSTWNIIDGVVEHSNTGNASGGHGGMLILELPEKLTAERVLAEYLVTVPIQNHNNLSIGMAIGSDQWNYNSGLSGALTYNALSGSSTNSELFEVYSHNSPSSKYGNFREERTYRISTVISLEENNFDLYVDGKLFINNKALASTGDNIKYIGIYNMGRCSGSQNWFIDNVLVMADPIISSSFMDTQGMVLQSQSERPNNKKLVSETFYDDLHRGFASTSALEAAGGLGFVDNFAAWDATNNNISDGTLVETELGSEAFSAVKYENTPTSRITNKKHTGSDFSLTGNNSESIEYDNAVQLIGIDQTLNTFLSNYSGSNYRAVKTTNPDGLESVAIKDKMGNTILTKTGTVKGIKTNIERLTYMHGTTGVTIVSPFDQEVSFVIESIGGGFPTGAGPIVGYPHLKISSTNARTGDLLNEPFTNGQFNCCGTLNFPAGNVYIDFVAGSTDVYSLELKMVTSVEEDADVYLYSKQSYDDANNTLKSYPPNYFDEGLLGVGGTQQLIGSSFNYSENNKFITTTQYDYNGRVISVESPDEGTQRFKYDFQGRLRFSQDAEGESNGYYSYFKYDNWSRLIEEGYIYGDYMTTNPFDATTPTTPATWRKKYIYGTHENTTYDRGALVRVEVNSDTDIASEVIETYSTDDGDAYLTSQAIQLIEEAVSLPTISYESDNLGKRIKTHYAKPKDSFIGGVINNSQNLTGKNVSVTSTEIAAGGSLTIAATDEIILLPGFWAKTGSSFVANASNSELDTDVITYDYDLAGRLIQMGEEDDADFYARYSYNKIGSVSLEELNNTTQDISYNYNYDNGWLTGISGNGFVQTLEYTPDDHSSMITKSTITIDGANYNYTYDYDKLGRLLTADHSNGTNYDLGKDGITRYDRNGNISRLQRASNTYNYDYTPGTNMLSSLGSGGSFSNDLNGNVTSRTGRTGEPDLSALSYDEHINKPLAIDVTGHGTTSFVYGADNQRLLKKDTEGGNVYKTYYAYGGQLNPVFELRQGVSATTDYKYIYGLLGLVTIKKGDDLLMVTRDHQGSTRVVTTETGSISAKASYFPFGSTINNGAYTSLSADATYLFTGQEQDTETSLQNFKARMYDDVAGRFYGIDPQGQFASPFVGIGNNPVMMTDPDGEYAHLIAGAVIGAWAGGSISSGHINPLKWEGKDWAWAGAGAAGGALLSQGFFGHHFNYGAKFGTSKGNVTFFEQFGGNMAALSTRKGGVINGRSWIHQKAIPSKSSAGNKVLRDFIQDKVIDPSAPKKQLLNTLDGRFLRPYKGPLPIKPSFNKIYFVDANINGMPFELIGNYNLNLGNIPDEINLSGPSSVAPGQDDVLQEIINFLKTPNSSVAFKAVDTKFPSSFTYLGKSTDPAKFNQILQGRQGTLQSLLEALSGTKGKVQRTRNFNYNSRSSSITLDFIFR